MAAVNLKINAEPVVGYAKAMREGPRKLVRNLAIAYQAIGRYDITTFRASLSDKLHLKQTQTPNAFRMVASDPERATTIGKLFIDEYTKWAAAGIFQTGGTITGHGKYLTILTNAARDGGGKRFTAEKLRQMIDSKQARLIPTPRGYLIVKNASKSAKRSGIRGIILAVLRKQVTEQKRIDFYENAERNSSMHDDILETAVENTLVEIASDS